ncbi:MAG: hypothetical protein L0Z73_05440 [Gammaproteobacteria bacterium]|nr:hypothetical protein [Gammaproteobacteria bacterium]
MNIIKYRVLLIITCLSLCTSVTASYGEDTDLMYEFQLEQLMDPSEEQMQLEKDGYVFIYDGLKESDIQLVLDKHYNRMGSMMFINVIWTDEAGNPIVDTDSGLPLKDDDC